MNKKTIKILALILIIGISIPVITAATGNQEEALSLFSIKENNLELKTTTNRMSIAEDLIEKTQDVSSIPEEDFNIHGRWGIYNTNNEGSFKASEEKNTICGKVLYNTQKVYFYLQMNKVLKKFDGVVLYDDDFHLINGNYLRKNGRFIAMWTCEGVDGWITGELL